jgi:hypothetical protein
MHDKTYNNLPMFNSHKFVNVENNPKLLASFLDLIGMNLTTILTRIAMGEIQIGMDDAKTLMGLHSLVGQLRDACGIGTEWHMDNLWNDCTIVLQAIHSIRNAEAAKASATGDKRMLPANEAADAIMQMLRADGVIG